MAERSFAHGTSQGYNYHKCRCDECAEWARRYHREYYHRNGGIDYQRSRRVSRKEQLRAGHVKRKYNLDWSTYEALIASQDGRCANRECDAVFVGDDAVQIYVDHDHSCCESTPTCGECTRGLLCHQCNISSGHQGDDPRRLRGLADYLDK